MLHWNSSSTRSPEFLIRSVWSAILILASPTSSWRFTSTWAASGWFGTGCSIDSGKQMTAIDRFDADMSLGSLRSSAARWWTHSTYTSCPPAPNSSGRKLTCKCRLTQIGCSFGYGRQCTLPEGSSMISHGLCRWAKWAWGYGVQFS